MPTCSASVGPAAAVTVLIVRGVQVSLPPAARFRIFTGSAIAVALAFAATAAVAVLTGDMGSQGSRLLLIAVGVLALFGTFEVWVDRHKPPIRVLVVGKRGGGRGQAQNLVKREPKAGLVGLFANDMRHSTNGNATSELSHPIVERRPDLVVLTESAGRNEALDRLLVTLLCPFVL